MNKVILVGNLGKDPEVRYTPGGQPVANFSVATNEAWTDKAGAKQERTEWHTVVLWGRQAEIAEQFLQKGRLVYVEGRLETRKWQDQAGADRYTTEVRGQVLQMLDRGERGEGGGERAAADGSERPRSAGGPDRGGPDRGAPERGGPDRGDASEGSERERDRPGPRMGAGGGGRSAPPAGPSPDDMGPPPDEDDIPF